MRDLKLYSARHWLDCLITNSMYRINYHWLYQLVQTDYGQTCPRSVMKDNSGYFSVHVRFFSYRVTDLLKTLIIIRGTRKSYPSVHENSLNTRSYRLRSIIYKSSCNAYSWYSLDTPSNFNLFLVKYETRVQS